MLDCPCRTVFYGGSGSDALGKARRASPLCGVAKVTFLSLSPFPSPAFSPMKFYLQADGSGSKVPRKRVPRALLLGGGAPRTCGTAWPPPPPIATLSTRSGSQPPGSEL